MADTKLQAEIRQPGKASQLREQGMIPIIMYGPAIENQSLKVKKGDLEKVYNQAGEYSLVDLKVADSEPVKILIKDIQRDSVKEDILHADFYQVKMDEKITTEIPINFLGESKAVKELGGFLVKNLYSIEVECLPGDLVDEIEVDVSRLETFDDLIRLKDIEAPKGIEFTGDMEEMVVNVTPPEEEEEEELPEDEAAAVGEEGKEEAEGESEEGGKAEGEEKGGEESSEK